MISDSRLLAMVGKLGNNLLKEYDAATALYWEFQKSENKGIANRSKLVARIKNLCQNIIGIDFEPTNGSLVFSSIYITTRSF